MQQQQYRVIKPSKHINPHHVHQAQSEAVTGQLIIIVEIGIPIHHASHPRIYILQSNATFILRALQS
tara:strand:- start:248 stop:448 length:201 start_codon:yes stop_codon:yes gene_type:complete